MPPGTEGIKTHISMLRAAFPDLHYTIEDSIAEGDRVVQRTTAQGTMLGDFMGMSASGQSPTWSETHVKRYAAGKSPRALGRGGPDGDACPAWLGFAQTPGQPELSDRDGPKARSASFLLDTRWSYVRTPPEA